MIQHIVSKTYITYKILGFTMESSSGNNRSFTEVSQHETSMVLRLLAKGFYAKQIAVKLRKSQATIHRHIQKLKKLGFLTEKARTSCKIYEVSEHGETAIKTPEVSPFLVGYEDPSQSISLGVHYTAYIPIIKAGITPANFWDTVNEKLNNTVQKFKKFRLAGITVRETSKGIEVHALHRKLRSQKDIYTLINNVVIWVMGNFSQFGYELDIQHFRVTDIHWTLGGKAITPSIEKCERATMSLNRFRAKITPRDQNQPAKAWIDASPEPNFETNDLTYAEMFLRMPMVLGELVKIQKRQAGLMATYATHLNAHIPVLTGMNTMLKKLDRILSQRKIKEFL